MLNLIDWCWAASYAGSIFTAAVIGLLLSILASYWIGGKQ